ncbi:hypothetical protein [Rathayibacter sp. AY1E1]|uniref:hypothetical protein n=1 Tax=Rathayibacter sp. AY1E1 TaxID=2080549 RepID=UPI000CE7B9EC|nr:hypothetical protein [Rathayibacter sp. AY1E1]PPH51198.1 hypothetical protein C5C67_11820 [Rathayibacter sp. AY1E1]
MTLEKFHHTAPSGYEFVLPRFENIPMRVIRDTYKLQGVEQTFTMLEQILTEEQFEQVLDLDQGQFNDLMKAWKGKSEVEPGESTASSTS